MSPKSLDEVQKAMKKSATYVKEIPVLIGENLGNDTLKLNMSLEDFIQRSDVYNREFIEEHELPDSQISQRDEKPSHVKGLAEYTLKGLMNHVTKKMRYEGRPLPESVAKLQNDIIGRTPYTSLQPLVCCMDTKDLAFKDEEPSITFPDGVNVALFQNNHRLVVIDGQHRRSAFQEVRDWLQAIRTSQQYPNKPKFFHLQKTYPGRLDLDIYNLWDEIFATALDRCFISVEVHLNLNDIEKKQLFADLNMNQRKVELGTTL